MKIYCFDRQRNVGRARRARRGQKGITKSYESWQERDARSVSYVHNVFTSHRKYTTYIAKVSVKTTTHI